MIRFKIEGVSEEGKSFVRKLSLADTVEEMTFSQWVDLQLLIEAWPDWLKAFSEKPPEDQAQEITSWGPLKEAEYLRQMALVINNFCLEGSLEDIIEIPVFTESHDSPGLEVLAGKIFRALAEYRPQDRDRFTHHGRTFVVPGVETIVTGDFESITYMPRAKVKEVISALQRAHLYGAKGEDGKPALPRSRYYTDLGMIAAICREEIDGQEQPGPSTLEDWESYVEERAKFFADIPANIAIDIGFFLLNSLVKLLATDLSALRSNLQKRRRRLRVPKIARRLFGS